jgi:hypothetical protein
MLGQGIFELMLGLINSESLLLTAESFKVFSDYLRNGKIIQGLLNGSKKLNQVSVDSKNSYKAISATSALSRFFNGDLEFAQLVPSITDAIPSTEHVISLLPQTEANSSLPSNASKNLAQVNLQIQRIAFSKKLMTV